MRFGYNKYMANHYAYMTRVAELREPESYTEAAKDANWRARMEEEMHTLAKNERRNRSIVEVARAMEEKSLPKFYWTKAIRTAVYIQNRIGDKVSAHELYFGTTLNFR